MSTHEVNMLNPTQVYFYRSSGGVLQAVINGETYEEVHLFRSFPMKYSLQYISVRNKKGEELGIIEDVQTLEDDSLALIEEELQYRYFLPKVLRIEKIKQKAELWFWDITTNLGETSIIMRNLHDHIHFPSENRMILIDIDGRRCDIENWRQLDSHSQKLLQDVL